MRAGFIHKLGEARYGRESGLVGELNLLASTGLPLPEGIVLTTDAHQEFMEVSGLLRGIQAAARRPEDANRQALEAQSRYGSKPIEGELNRAICDALIELGASAVVVLSQDLTESGLGSIPEVQAAIRSAWLSLEGLKRQIEAAARGEDLPAWPVLIQRELQPVYTGWSISTGRAGGGSMAGCSGKRSAALYDLRPAVGVPSPDRRSVDHLTLEAEALLGEPVQLKWGLEDGRWYILSTRLSSRCCSPDRDSNSAEFD